jgi:hypothetical protein
MAEACKWPVAFLGSYSEQSLSIAFKFVAPDQCHSAQSALANISARRPRIYLAAPSDALVTSHNLLLSTEHCRYHLVGRWLSGFGSVIRATIILQFLEVSYINTISNILSILILIFKLFFSKLFAHYEN